MLDGFYNVVCGAFGFVSVFDKDLESVVVSHHFFVHFDNGLGNLRNQAVFSEHGDGGVNDVIFEHLFFYGFALTVRFFLSSGKAHIVVMDFAAFACTAFPAHSPFAISANKLSGKYVIIYFFFATGRDFVFLVDSIHLQPQLVCNNRRKDVAVFRQPLYNVCRAR